MSYSSPSGLSKVSFTIDSTFTVNQIAKTLSNISWFNIIGLADALYNGTLLLELMRTDGVFISVLTVDAPAGQGRFSGFDAIGLFTASPQIAYPMTIRFRVSVAPTLGTCAIKVVSS